MNREQKEMQFLGVYGILKESYKIILTCQKIFTQITLALILPLSLVFLANIQISELLFSDIVGNTVVRDDTPAGTQNYKNLSDLLSSEWTVFWLFKLVYFIFVLIFSLLSTSAVVYTIASIYTGRDVTFQRVMSVVPRVWKRLMITFFAIFVLIFCYIFIAVLVIVIFIISLSSTKILVPISIALLIVFISGLVYLSVVWQLATVVSVLEDACGFQAMKKSRNLLRGKMGVAVAIFIKLGISQLVTLAVFEKLFVHGDSLGLVSRGVLGVLCLALVVKLFLLVRVVQTVLYLVCKSYHHENVDKSILSDHLEVFHGEYVPLKEKDVQLEHVYV
ncbi:hypothetical protein RJ641_029495 [Dillenia turbinata]|uniref:Transmembrane protein n=1 Tax=Dillenia turbinata TaxID=194707 RepID=A0AAN8VYD0_9MAGN